MNRSVTWILVILLASSLLNEIINAIPVNETPASNVTATKSTSEVCTGDFCKNKGICFLNAENKRECNCTLTNFTGKTCDIPKEEKIIDNDKVALKEIRLSCPENICQNHGECYLGADGKPECDCSKTSYNGTLCTEPLCPPDFCENGGVCKIVNNKIRYCDCSTIMFTGSLCQFPKCSIGFCPSYETCVVDYFQKKLSCETGDIKKKHKNCLEFPCQNNGTCIIKYSGEPECDCTNTGYSGIFCETPVCEKVNCNNGQCRFNLSDDKKTYCLCEPGYRGRFCEEKYCPDHYCFNGGTCSVDQQGNLSCQCQPGYEGYRCEHRKVCGDCDQGFCLKNLETNKFECICDEHFTGENCSKLKPCPDNYCNGGKCEMDKRSYKCICDNPNKTGTRCEITTTNK